MAGMRAVHKKNGTTFKYSGDLKETIEKAEKELKEKEGTTQWLFLKWQYDNARKAFEKYNRRLEDLKDFIKLAKEELAKREEAAGHGRDNTNRGKKRRCRTSLHCSERQQHRKRDAVRAS
jgi:hypothetical protein